MAIARLFRSIPLIAALLTGAALHAGTPSNLDVERAIRSLAVASPYRLSEQARQGTIRYRLAMLDRTPWPWPETGEQHVEWRDAEAVLTICSTCGTEAAPSAAELQQYLQPNEWVQSRDPRIATFARNAAGGGSVDARLRRLVLAVQKHMDGPIDFRDYGSARKAFDTRSGDCTEFALLLAATVRARGIPARLVAGVSYSSRFLGRTHAFAPHMWVQAWDGARWVSYDAGVGQFDAGHIALAIGDGDPANFHHVMAAIARLRIEDAAGIRPVGPRERREASASDQRGGEASASIIGRSGNDESSTHSASPG